MRRVIVLAAVLLAPAAAFAQSFQLHGFVTARGIRVSAQPSWAVGGAGRFDVGARDVNDKRNVNTEMAQLGVDWTPTTWLLLHADGLARREPRGTIGRRAGLVQAFADLHSEQLRLRAGAFWFPTSRENVDPMWNSRYTITYSALNTWIGEEVRPLGVDLQYSPNFYFTLGGTAFRGIDTMGTELSARGWALGNRLSVYNEEIAAIPETTRPISHDIDHRTGYSERIRVQLPERATLQVTHIDNRARLLIRDAPETPWHTRFNVVGGDIGASSPTTVAAEWAAGDTAVGFPGGSFTMDFSTVYILLSQKNGSNRWTTRAERFSTRTHGSPAVDFARENGHAFTVAWLHDNSPSFRTGVEYVRAVGDRPALSGFNLQPNSGGSTITLEMRFSF